MSSHSQLDVRVVRRFDASPRQVFDAWLDPRLLERWMFGPAVRDEQVVRLAIDACVGGSFSFVVRRQGQEIEHVGEYMILDRPRHLVFTWAMRQDLPDTSRVSVEIEPQVNGCQLILTHQLHPDWSDHAERTQAAWTKMLDALDSALNH